MYLKKLSSLLIISIYAVVFISCNKKEGCTDPNALNYDPEAGVDMGCEYPLSVEFHLHQNVDDVILNEGTLYDLEGVATKLTLVQFYISNIRLVDDDGNETSAGATYLLLNPDTEDYEIGELPPGDYKKLRFDVGIDSATNHGDPSQYAIGDPLGAQFPNMHWGWDFGYIFIRIDGETDVTGDGVPDNPDGLFEIHLGTDHYLATIEIDYALAIAEGNENIYHLEADWGKFFAGTNLAIDNTTHTTDNEALADIVFNNIFTMFSKEE